MSKLLEVSAKLSKRVSALRFSSPITHVYNPLEYAWKPHAMYLEKWGKGPKQVLFMGMNPGPFGMAQTGVPFGEISAVRDWMKISAPVNKPKLENRKRLIEGFDCSKSEVSGRRLWGWAQDRFQSPENFFKRFFVINYCPLVFMEASGKNFTPDHLEKNEATPLLKACDEALVETVDLLKPEWVIGVGAFAMKRAEQCLDLDKFKVAKILHPSPASPLANRGWSTHIERELLELGIQLS